MNGLIDVVRNALIFGTLLGVVAFLIVSVMLDENAPPAPVHALTREVSRPNVIEARARARPIAIERVKVLQPTMIACRVEPSVQEPALQGRSVASPPVVASTRLPENDGPSQAGFSVDANPVCTSKAMEVVSGRAQHLRNNKLKKTD